MDSINTFEGGQNSDLSKFIPNKSKYIKALNVRPLTDVGGSHGALVNIKGNNCELNFKSAVLNKIEICDNVEIGAISTVTKDITQSGRYIGSVARYVGPLSEFEN